MCQYQFKPNCGKWNKHSIPYTKAGETKDHWQDRTLRGACWDQAVVEEMIIKSEKKSMTACFSVLV
jgi:hypothetical protein